MDVKGVFNLAVADSVTSHCAIFPAACSLNYIIIIMGALSYLGKQDLCICAFSITYIITIHSGECH